MKTSIFTRVIFFVICILGLSFALMVLNTDRFADYELICPVRTAANTNMTSTLSPPPSVVRNPPTTTTTTTTATGTPTSPGNKWVCNMDGNRCRQVPADGRSQQWDTEEQYIQACTNGYWKCRDEAMKFINLKDFAVSAHNCFRKLHGAAPLNWSVSVATDMKNAMDNICQKKIFDHADDRYNVGRGRAENLAADPDPRRGILQYYYENFQSGEKGHYKTVVNDRYKSFACVQANDYPEWQNNNCAIKLTSGNGNVRYTYNPNICQYSPNA